MAPRKPKSRKPKRVKKTKPKKKTTMVKKEDSKIDKVKKVSKKRLTPEQKAKIKKVIKALLVAGGTAITGRKAAKALNEHNSKYMLTLNKKTGKIHMTMNPRFLNKNVLKELKVKIPRTNFGMHSLTPVNYGFGQFL